MQGTDESLSGARLCLIERPLVFLDEATSAMDNLTEKAVMKSVLDASESSTVIAVAHRLSSIADFDRILVFSNGKIVGDGAFSELLAHNRYFQELYCAAETQNK